MFGFRRSARPTRKGRSASSSNSTASPASSRCPTGRPTASLPARRKAEEGNESHIAAPMPGAVSTVAVKPGQQVKAGDVLLTLEAMKMETSLSAPRDGKISEERYGIDPNQVPDFIALRGDPSDKLPGAAGVGPKRTAQLLRRYGALDGVLEAGLFQPQAEILRLYRLIATMDAKAPLPSLDDQQPTWGSASTFARDWGLNQLADRLDEMA